jgi:DNA mismatch repair protein MSH5
MDESVAVRRVVIKPTLDAALDRLKRTYHGLGDFLVSGSRCARVCAPTLTWAWWHGQSTVAREISHTIPPTFAPSLAIVYWPQLGYLIAVPARCEGQVGAHGR